SPRVRPPMPAPMMTTLFTGTSFSHGQGRIKVTRVLAPPGSKFETGSEGTAANLGGLWKETNRGGTRTPEIDIGTGSWFKSLRWEQARCGVSRDGEAPWSPEGQIV